MNLIGVRAFRDTCPPSTKSGVRPATHSDNANMWGGALPEINATLIAPLTLIKTDWTLIAVEVEGRAPRAMFVRVGTNLENLSTDDLSGLYEIAGRGQLVDIDAELPITVQRLLWRERRRPTDPDLEARAMQLRDQIAELNIELEGMNATLEEQRSGEYDKRLAAEAEKRAADQAKIHEAHLRVDERQFQRERARRAGRWVLERLGAEALGLDPAELGIVSPGVATSGGILPPGARERIAAQKAKDAAKKQASAADGAPPPAA